VLSYNDLDQVEAAFRQHPDAIAAIIVEARRGQHESDRPDAGVSSRIARSLRSLRRGADLRRSDDRLSVALARRASLYGVTPDLTTLGKSSAADARGAFGGKRAIMHKIAPLGPGVSSRDALGQSGRVAAGRPRSGDPGAGIYDRLSARTRR